MDSNSQPELKNIQPTANPEIANDKTTDPIRYFLTKDPILLQQYYDLRERVYRSDSGYVKYDGQESEFDRKGDVFVAIEGGKVVGGMRLSVSNENELLPNEDKEPYRYFSLFNGIGYEWNSEDLCSEIGAFAVDKAYRNHTISKNLLELGLTAAVRLGCKYTMGVSKISNCRNYQILIKKMGFRNVQIIHHVPWISPAEFNYEEAFPIIVKL